MSSISLPVCVKIVALRAKFESERAAVLATVSGDGAAEATRLLVNRLLHGPAVNLRALAAEDPVAREEAERLLAALFALDHTPTAPRK